MFDNIDNMARIEHEIEKRLEAACEKNGWYVAEAMMPPESTTLHIEKFSEGPVAGEDALLRLIRRSPLQRQSSEPRRRSSGSTRKYPTPAHRATSRPSLRSTPRSAFRSWRRNMNMEQRAQQYAEIQKLEGLLAYAVAHNETEDAERIRAQLVKMVEVI